jgi:hypothetical protein
LKPCPSRIAKNVPDGALQALLILHGWKDTRQILRESLPSRENRENDQFFVKNKATSKFCPAGGNLRDIHIASGCVS